MERWPAPPLDGADGRPLFSRPAPCSNGCWGFHQRRRRRLLRGFRDSFLGFLFLGFRQGVGCRGRGRGWRMMNGVAGHRCAVCGFLLSDVAIDQPHLLFHARRSFLLLLLPLLPLPPTSSPVSRIEEEQLHWRYSSSSSLPLWLRLSWDPSRIPWRCDPAGSLPGSPSLLPPPPGDLWGFLPD